METKTVYQVLSYQGNASLVVGTFAERTKAERIASRRRRAPEVQFVEVVEVTS